MTVYVTQEQPRLNYADAQRFGALTFVCEYDYSLGENSKANAATRENARKILEFFNSEQDFLLLVGDPVLIGLVMAYALTKGPVNVLKWDKSTHRYAVIRGVTSISQA